MDGFALRGGTLNVHVLFLRYRSIRETMFFSLGLRLTRFRQRFPKNLEGCMAGHQADNRVRVGPFDLSDGLSRDEWMARRNAQVAQRGRAEVAGGADVTWAGKSMIDLAASGMEVPHLSRPWLGLG